MVRPTRLEIEFEHRFEPHLPAYVGIRRDGAQIHLSEHHGDARPGTLVYIWVDDAPLGRELSLTDPDHNRLRIAEPLPDLTPTISTGPTPSTE